MSDNATMAAGALGLGMASRIDANSSVNRSRLKKHQDDGDFDSYEIASDGVLDSIRESGRHNINALNAGRPNCKFPNL